MSIERNTPVVLWLTADEADVLDGVLSVAAVDLADEPGLSDERRARLLAVIGNVRAALAGPLSRLRS